MIVASEYNFLNPKLNEISDIIKNTRLENSRKIGYNYCRKIEVKCNNKFFYKNKIQNQNITIKDYHIDRAIKKNNNSITRKI